jgi:hypothetical protein
MTLAELSGFQVLTNSLNRFQGDRQKSWSKKSCVGNILVTGRGIDLNEN